MGPLPRRRPAKGLPKDVMLLQMAIMLLHGKRLNYEQLTTDYGLERRTATRYVAALKKAGLPVARVQVGHTVEFALHHLRTRLNVEAIDVSAASAKTLSLLLVAAALLPKNLGVRDAVDATVRQALRFRGTRLSTDMRRYEEVVIVLEDEAKDYTGREDIFEALFDAVLEGWLIEIDYTSPRTGSSTRRIFAATLGLYKGGLYVLGVDENDDGHNARWWALERLDDVPIVVTDDAGAPRKLPMGVRLAAVASARRRWGPVRAVKDATSSTPETLVTLHFSAAAAPSVRARPWHTAVDAVPWEDGGLRVSVRLTGETFLFESWLLSWGAQVQVLRPPEMAARLADEMEKGAAAHRAAADEFARMLAED